MTRSLNDASSAASEHAADPASRLTESEGECFRRYVNPQLAELLGSLAMDKCFVRGSGSELFDEDGTPYLDAVSGYGAVPFGHNPDFVWEALRAVESQQEPSMVQPSLQAGAGRLAQKLLEAAPRGLEHVTFANSGAEAVEAAIKACRLATGRLGILSTSGSFHGKTLGALSATGRDHYQSGTGAPATGFERVAFGDADALEEAFERCAKQTAAFIVEPIQGEGGVVEPPLGYLKLARRLCDRYGVLLIVDEIQTGLGRTGELFACSVEGITPDVITLAKALGGGMLPIGACLFHPRAWSHAFATRHSSTFAGNALATRVGLSVLERLQSDDGQVLENVARRGQHLKRGLLALARRYPAVIREVRGRGLMLGVELGTEPDSFSRGEGALLAQLEQMGGLAAMAASYLLNVERVRVAPTLNGSRVLRVQPPLTVTQKECDRIIAAFAALARILASRSSDALIAHLVRDSDDEEVTTGVFRVEESRRRLELQSEEPGRFAFVAHLLDSASFADFDASLGRLAPSELHAFTERFEPVAEPFAAARVRIESERGKVAVGDFIAIPKTAQQLLRASPEEAMKDVAAAVDLAKSRGARIVGLGGYTSVVSKNLRPLLKLGVPLTTGNGYTVVSAVDAAVAAADATGHPLCKTRAAVVGGGGSIGSALSGMLAEHVPELTLIGRDADSSRSRLRYATVLARMFRTFGRALRAGLDYAPGSLAYGMSRLPAANAWAERKGRLRLNPTEVNQLLEQVRSLPIRWTDDLAGSVPHCEMVFLVTSSPEPLLNSSMVRPGTVVCDLSRPPNVREDLYQREDVMVIDGGVVAVPGKPDLGWHFGCPPGVAFACMAETMMLALEHRYEHTSLGSDLQEESLTDLRRYAREHGFKLAELRSRGRPLELGGWRDQFSRNIPQSLAMGAE